MKKRLLKKIILIIMLLITAVFVTGCQWFSLEDEHRVVLDDKTYNIDPTTLLQSLAKGNKDSFILRVATPPATPNWSSRSVPWKQADYFFIAQAFHQFAFGQSLNDWKLQGMFFKWDCTEVGTGLQVGGFTFFKNERLDNKDSRLIHHIYISPKENLINYVEYEEGYYPELGEGPFLDLSKIKITAEQAMQIADRVGGSKFREEVKDNCSIPISIEAAGNYKGWYISYSPYDKQIPAFHVIVNETSGEYVILR